MNQEPFDCLVQIWARSGRASLVFRGTGFLIGPRQILTCKHVVRWRETDEGPFEAAEYIELRRLTATGPIAIRGQATNEPIAITKLSHAETHDIVVIEIDEKLQNEVPPLLSGLNKDDNSYGKWKQKTWITAGFPAVDNGKSRERNELTKSNIPDDCTDDIRYPRRFSFDTDIVKGCSGSPIWIYSNTQWICIGMMKLGGEAKGKSSGFSTELILSELSDLRISLAEVTTISPQMALCEEAPLSLNADDTNLTNNSVAKRWAVSQYLNKRFLIVLTLLVITLTTRLVYKNGHLADSPPKQPPASEGIVLFRLRPSNTTSQSSDPTKVLEAKLKSYLAEQSKDIPCQQNIGVISIDEPVSTESEALQRAQKYQRHLIIWGDYLATGHQVSMQLHARDAVLQKTWSAESMPAAAQDNVLNASLESLIGKRLLALLHLEIGFIAAGYHQNDAAFRHFQQYQLFDRKFTDQKSMYYQANPSKDVQLAIVSVYRYKNSAEATEIINAGYDACDPHDKNCKGEFENQRGCIMLANKEVLAGKKLIDSAHGRFSSAGNIIYEGILLCNMAEAMEASNSNEEALLKWEACATQLSPYVTVDTDAFMAHRGAVFAMGRLLHHACDAERKSKAKRLLESIALFGDKDRIYADARYLLAHMNTDGSHDERRENLRLALRHLPEDTSKKKRAQYLSLKGDLDYRSGDYFSAAQAKSEAAELFMSIGYNPVTLRKCHENEAKCDYLVYLDSHHHTKSIGDLQRAEEVTFHYSPYNGIFACLGQSGIKRLLLNCGYGKPERVIRASSITQPQLSTALPLTN